MVFLKKNWAFNVFPEEKCSLGELFQAKTCIYQGKVEESACEGHVLMNIVQFLGSWQSPGGLKASPWTTHSW